MAKLRTGRLHVLTVRQVQTAGEGDHADGGGLLLRVRDASMSWVFRYTSATGRRREMGLGAVRRGSVADAGQSLTSARKQAREARDQLEAGADPIDVREQRRAAAREAEAHRRRRQRLGAVFEDAIDCGPARDHELRGDEHARRRDRRKGHPHRQRADPRAGRAVACGLIVERDKAATAVQGACAARSRRLPAQVSIALVAWVDPPCRCSRSTPAARLP